MLLIQITGGLVLIALVATFFLRGRLNRSETSKPRSRRDLRPTLPASPYQPSRGFRILNGEEPPAPVAPPLPRLDENKEFVFGEPAGSLSEPLVPHLRHDEKWALERSMRHAPRPRLRRRRFTLTVALVIIAMVFVAVLALHHFGSNAAPTGLMYISQVDSWSRMI